MICHDKLVVLLNYNPNTGVFTWLQDRGRLAKKGSVAGSVDSGGYGQIRIQGKSILAHRLAWFYHYKDSPKEHIDHINGNRLDNRIENLREVSRFENQQNQKKYNTNKSGITGVSWHKQHNKWYASVQKNKKLHFLGLFDNIFDAAAASKSARNRLGFHENHGR